MYAAPAGITASPLYSVKVGPMGSLRNSFVYTVNNIGLTQLNWQGHGWNIRTELTTAWTSFDLGGSGGSSPWAAGAPVTVQVNMVIPAAALKQPAVRVLPSAYGITLAVFDGSAVVFCFGIDSPLRASR